jgi:AraC-like DNA-binding protein
VPPYARHRIRSHFRPGISIYYEPHALEWRDQGAEATRMSKVIVRQEDLDEFKRLLIGNFDEDSLTTILQLGAQIAGLKLKVPNSPGDLDSRIQEVLRRLEADLENFRSLTSIAADVNLSISRLTHVFSEQMGTPFRSYLLWLKLRRAIENVVVGRSLTDAAHRAGFADSAHFSRVFSRTFGFSPSFLKFVKVEAFLKTGV